MLFLPFFAFVIAERFGILKCMNRMTRQTWSFSHLLLQQTINNVGVALCVYTMYRSEILYHWLFSIWLASIAGVALFHCQHTFNPPYVVNNDTWTVKDWFDRKFLHSSSLVFEILYWRYRVPSCTSLQCENPRLSFEIVS